MPWPWPSPDDQSGVGYKQSGIGREMDVEGFEEYLETKTIAVPVDFPAQLEAVGGL